MELNTLSISNPSEKKEKKNLRKIETDHFGHKSYFI